MHYCFKARKKVYGCSHYDCNNRELGETYGTKIRGMRWCVVAGKHVYSCDHFKCNN